MAGALLRLDAHEQTARMIADGIAHHHDPTSAASDLFGI
jgi:hypothetical protein